MIRIGPHVSLLAVVFLCSGISPTSAQVQWARYPGNPVLTPGAPGSWDPTLAVATTVMVHQGVYKMWYDGDGGFGHATSTDGVAWVRHPGNPVLQPGAPGAWDGNEIFQSSVMVTGGLYRMWYTGVDVSGTNRIGYATSADGVTWNRHPGNPVLDLGPPGSFDDQEVMHPAVLFDGALYRMWYNGHDGETQRILYAASPDGITWARFTSHPMLEPGVDGSWDDAELGPLCVLRSSRMVHLWYTGWNQAGQYAIGHATSNDGIVWQKSVAFNPVLRPGPAGSWDDNMVGVPAVILEGGTFRMWYGGSDGTFFQTGLATSTNVTDVAAGGPAPAPAPCSLVQSAPNPFIESTTIHYRVTAPTAVRLEILDVAGRHVRTLITGREVGAGLHAVAWDGRDEQSRVAGAGVYFMRLAAPSGAQSMRLIRIR